MYIVFFLLPNLRMPNQTLPKNKTSMLDFRVPASAELIGLALEPRTAFVPVTGVCNLPFPAGADRFWSVALHGTATPQLNIRIPKDLSFGAGLGWREAQPKITNPRPFGSRVVRARVGKSQAVAVSRCSAGGCSCFTPRIKSAAFCPCAAACTINFLSFFNCSSQFWM